MSYVYEEQKPELFTDDGQRTFIQVRDHVKELLKSAGAFRMQEGIGGASGDSWLLMACIDRMVELEEIREITWRPVQGTIAGQHRMFTSHVWYK